MGVTSKYFEEQGYDIKVFNLVNPEHSDGIDLFNFYRKGNRCTSFLHK